MDSHNQAEKFWDRIANNYDKEEKKDTQTYSHIFEKTRNYLKGSDVVLDYGCGTGLVSNEVAGNVKMVYAIDISSKMIEIAKNKATGCEIENIDYAYSTIFNDRYKNGSFDVILAFYILHLSDDSQRVIQRVNELLKPGGLFISATPCMGDKLILNKLLSIASKIGIVPKIKSFKFPDLEGLIKKENFEIIETECLHLSSRQYFIIAKKI